MRRTGYLAKGPPSLRRPVDADMVRRVAAALEHASRVTGAFRRPVLADGDQKTGKPLDSGKG